MNRNVTITIQIILFTLQSLNVGGLLPPKAQLAIGAAIASLQGAMAIIAHSYNPDGTTATVSYVPPKTLTEK